MGDVFTASGTKIYITTSAQTTDPADATAWAALTWTEIGLVESIGEYGDQSSTSSIAILGDGRQRKGKATRDAGDLQLVVAHDGSDAGQTKLVAAEASASNYGFKIVLNNPATGGGTGEINYFRGLVMGKRLNVGSNDSIVRNTFTIAVNTAVTVVPAA